MKSETAGDVQALPSHELQLLQLTDVLMGAVSYKFHKRTTSKAKLALLKKIESHLGKDISPTPRSEDKFNVFQFQPGGGW